MRSRSGQALRVITMIAVGMVLMACSLGELVSGEDGQAEPAPVRDAQWSMRLSSAKDPAVAKVAGDAVVVVVKEKVVVLDRRDGKARWSRPSGSRRSDGSQQVVVSGDSVVVLDRETTVVYDLANGDERFQWSSSRTYVNSATVTDSGLLVQSCDTEGKCTVSLLDLLTGKPSWQRVFAGPLVLLPPSPRDTTPGPGGPEATDLVEPLAPVTGKEAVVVSRGEARAPDPVTRLDVKTGAVLGTFTVPADVDAMTEWRSARLVDGLIVQAQRQCGPYRVYDARTGALLWNRVVDQRHLDLSSISVTIREMSVVCKDWPSVVAGGLLVSNPQDEPQIVDPKTGKPRWTAKSPAVWLGYDEGIAMAWTDPDGPYFAVDTATDKQLWTHSPPWLQDREPDEAKRALVAYAVSGGQFFYSGKEENGRYDYRSVVRVLDLRTGRPLWAADGDNRLLGVGDGWVVTTSAGRYGDPVDIRLFKR